MASKNEYNIEYDTEYDTDSHDDYSYSDSNSDSNTIELALEPSSIASRVGSRPKHSIGARIQAISFLELNMPYFEITAKTRISKAQIYKLREKALLRC